MAIIGLLVAVLTPGLVGQLGRARAKSAQMQLETVAAAVEMFRSDVNRYPTDAEGLQSLLTDPGALDGWTGPYLKNARAMQDPWGRNVEYQMNSDGRSFVVRSLGRDGAPGGSGLDRDLTAPAS